MPQPSASRASRAFGAMIFSVFGGCWLLAWSLKSFGRSPLAPALILAATAGLFMVAFRGYLQFRVAGPEPESPATQRANKVFTWVNILQGAAIFLAANILANLGHMEWFVPTFIAIVGAHFLPLAAVYQARRHGIIGAAMLAWAGLYPFLTPQGPAHPMGCLGAGLILWASALAGSLLPERATEPA